MKRKLGISKFNMKKQLELAVCGILLFAKKKFFLFLLLIPLFFIFFSYYIYIIFAEMLSTNYSSLNIILISILFISIFLLGKISFMILKMYKKIQTKPNYVIE